MTPEQTVLVERVRALIADEPVVREVSMFGGRSVMVNEKMIVSARKDGGLLVRVDADQHAHGHGRVPVITRGPDTLSGIQPSTHDSAHRIGCGE